jgi:hypothetical protein
VVERLTREELDERKEYLKRTISAPSILEKYGVKIVRNRCKGFCHNGKDYNMKVFKDGCNCFVCNKSMDIFDITMHFNRCDFWTAFELLGGTEKPSFTATIMASKAKRERDRQIAKAEQEKEKLRLANANITAYRNLVERSKPLSDDWCYYYNKLQYQIYIQECMTEKR